MKGSTQRFHFLPPQASFGEKLRIYLHSNVPQLIDVSKVLEFSGLEVGGIPLYNVNNGARNSMTDCVEPARRKDTVGCVVDATLGLVSCWHCKLLWNDRDVAENGARCFRLHKRRRCGLGDGLIHIWWRARYRH